MSQGLTRYAALAMTGLAVNATEADVAIMHKTPGSIANLAARVSFAFRSSATITTRINGADGTLTLSIPVGTSGYYEDNLNGDSIAEDDLMNYEIVTSASVGGSIRLTGIQVNFTPNDTSKTVVRYAMQSPTRNYWGSLTEYKSIQMHGNTQNLVELRSQFGFSSTCTLKNLVAYMSVNSRGGIIVKPRINSTDGTMLIDTANIGTGYFEDVTNTDTVDYGDLMCLFVGGGNIAGGSDTITVPWIAIDIETTDNSYYLIYGTPDSVSGATDPTFLPLGGSSTSTIASGSETSCQLDMNSSVIVSDMWTQTESGSEPASDIRITFRDTAADTVLYVDVPASTAGEFRSMFAAAVNSNSDVCLKATALANLYIFGFRCRDNSLGNTTAKVKILGGNILGGHIL